MSLLELVTTKATGTFGTFEVVDGNVTINKNQILVFFNATTALVPMNARSYFTVAEQHQAFDSTLMGLSAAGFTIQYIETVRSFMDPKARFAQWLKGELTPASVGLTLTPEELAVPTAYESAKAKFVAMFTPPVPPRELDPRPVEDSQKLKLVLRSGKPYQVSNGNHTIGYASAKKVWDSHINKPWATTVANTSSERSLGHTYVSASGYSSRNLRVRPGYVEIGCQTIQRNVLEEFAQRMGWM